ncbi:DUF1465 family protein [Novosphingobium sp. TCA1]|uniref:DUF1465 domain-containing protein n=1 Tax=Novosphingobium pentaromativorans TaxID=205844 RepID=A0A2W5QQS5_9SPHN|nr:DUF1465 family protein [Novosphingobium sp. TCA1]PZQ57063.1 MAG: DUF1465 domain-containing protein [Novosphingobium pentaromativorans]GFE74061.1 hypothetical protein NTCA1_17100 [Novosphingobium sp. TCA1]
MPNSVTINPRIVEALYCEAMLLADEVRHAFAPETETDGRSGARSAGRSVNSGPVRLALSSEGLRTTTRMMHAIAWLLNHRAYFMGEIDQYQLRRNGRLSPDLRHSEASGLAALKPEIVELVEATQRFYDRLLRLDGKWRLYGDDRPSAIERLRERLERRLAS